jgi:hypothetical protein
MPDPPFGPLKGRISAGAPTKAPMLQPTEEETSPNAAIPKPSKPMEQVQPSTEDTRVDLEYSRMIKTLCCHFLLLILVLMYSVLWFSPHQNESLRKTQLTYQGL